MPELQGYDHVALYLAELGYASGGGMSIAPLTYTEVDCWSRLMQTPVSIAEVEMLMHLSRVYCGARTEAEDPLCPPPFSPELEMDEDKRSKVDGFFRSISKRRK